MKALPEAPVRLTAQGLLLLAIVTHAAGVIYSPHGEVTWINCSSHSGCVCKKSPDCYDNGPGVCMSLMHGSKACRFCPLGMGLLYHLPEITLPEGIPFLQVCQTMKVCGETRCFGPGVQCRESGLGMNSRPRQDRGECVCERGFKTERLAPGVERCIDIDECASPNRSMIARRPQGFGHLPSSLHSSHLHDYCPPNSRCENNDGGYQCICDEGYRERYENINRLTCDDIDECEQLGFGACSWYLSCVNEAGTYRCANPLHQWIPNEAFLLILAIILLLLLNILLCWMCSAARRCLGHRNELPVRERQKQLDKYSVARL